MLYSGTDPESYITKYTSIRRQAPFLGQGCITRLYRGVIKLVRRGVLDTPGLVAGDARHFPGPVDCFRQLIDSGLVGRKVFIYSSHPPGFVRRSKAAHTVPRGEKMLYSGTDPESYITEYTSIRR